MQHVLGDALTDLPPVSNFDVAEALDYACDPLHPYQHYLRRELPDWQVRIPTCASAPRYPDLF